MQDTGIGITPEDQLRLFQAFGKLDRGMEMNQQGVGLGLMISNMIAERLGEHDFNSEYLSQFSGRKGLKVQSAGLNLGSKFFFEVQNQINQENNHSIRDYLNKWALKVRESVYTLKMGREGGGIVSQPRISLMDYRHAHSQTDEEQHQFRIDFKKPPLPAHRQDESLSPINSSESEVETGNCGCPDILIVDDTPFNVMALTLTLKDYDLKIDKAYSGEEAFAKVCDYRQQHICVKYRPCTNYKFILMDIEMPGWDGLKTAEKIMELASDSFIIGCSGYDGDDIRAKAFKAGMRDFITKPVQVS